MTTKATMTTMPTTTQNCDALSSVNASAELNNMGSKSQIQIVQ